MSFNTLLVEKRDRVGLVTLNRPKALNALCAELVAELEQALNELEADAGIAVIVVTGSEKAFAAGADIKEMKDRDFIDVFTSDFITKGWERLSQCRKPTIAAVAGYALGGGCELAMMCDMIIAAENAKFGQPEITIGTIPGAGGTQRLTRAVGKAKAMDLVLTGRMMDVHEAERAGLVSRIVPADKLVDEALSVGAAICALSGPSLEVAKACLNKSFEGGLRDGVDYERRLFWSLFATEDQKEGMAAFVEKRAPAFRQR